MRGTEAEASLFGEPRSEFPSSGGGSSSSGEPSPPAPASSDKRTERLREELEKAISDEDYERAAAIRDKLKELGG
jgi:excinuclease UvrABC helicase subunit UvrB